MNTSIVGLKELREHTEKYVSQVKRGKSFTIVRRSRPLFKISPVDEWGDEGIWESVGDFKKLFPHSVLAERLLKALKAKNGQNR